MSDEDNIIREVEDDLRRERYQRLWKKYGPFVIGTIVVVLVAILGWQQWQAYQGRQREKEAESFLAAVDLLEDDKAAAAASAFGELADKAGPGYRAVARMHEAQAYLDQGNPERALAAYDALASDGSVNPKLRTLAALKGALLLADSASPEELKKRLTAPLRPRSPWRFAAQEIIAYAYYRTHEFAEARKAYQTLVNEYDAPAHVRDRARKMLSLIASEEAQGLGTGSEAEGARKKGNDKPASAKKGGTAAPAQKAEEKPAQHEASGSTPAETQGTDDNESTEDGGQENETAATGEKQQ